MLLQRIGSRVRSLRGSRKLTAREVAEKSGLSLRFYSQLEGGSANISVGRLAAVADALGTTLADLVAEERARPAPVALLGLRGAGKSSVGPRLAGVLGIPFVELDERIEERAGLDLSEIFDLHGEPYYRRLEAECIHDLLEKEQPCIIAMPGGIVNNEGAFEEVRRRCLTVWLRARPEDHMKRVIDQGDRRPMADRVDAMAELRAILSSRNPLYRRADFAIDTSARNVDSVVREILKKTGR